MFKRLMLVIAAAGMPLAACAPMPDPESKPVTMPDGKVYYPPPGGWPRDRGGESGGSGDGGKS